MIGGLNPDICIGAHTQINLIKSTWNQIVFTIFQLIWNQTDVCLVPNQSGTLPPTYPSRYHNTRNIIHETKIYYVDGISFFSSSEFIEISSIKNASSNALVRTRFQFHSKLIGIRPYWQFHFNYETKRNPDSVHNRKEDCQCDSIQFLRVHTEKSYRNLIESSRNYIVFTILRLSWNHKRTVSVSYSKSIRKC